VRRGYNGYEAVPINGGMNLFGSSPQSDDRRSRQACRDRAGTNAAAVLPNAAVRRALMGRPVVHTLHVVHARRHRPVPKELGPDD
jgi:hypothetical protein